MGSYTGDLKCNLKSVRMTDKVYEYIQSFEGDGFNQKFENLVLYFMEQEEQKRERIAELDRELIEKHREIQKLEQGRELMDSALESLQELQQMFAGELLRSNYKKISSMIQRADYMDKPELVKNIYLLNQETGKEHGLREIYQIFKEQSYEERPKLQQLVNDIVTEFQYQEMSMPELEPG